MSLLINNFEDRLTQLALTASEVKVVIAFLTEGGLSWLPKKLPDNVEFIVGIDLRITTPGALKLLQDKSASQEGSS